MINEEIKISLNNAKDIIKKFNEGDFPEEVCRPTIREQETGNIMVSDESIKKTLSLLLICGIIKNSKDEQLTCSSLFLSRNASVQITILLKKICLKINDYVKKRKYLKFKYFLFFMLM